MELDRVGGRAIELGIGTVGLFAGAAYLSRTGAPGAEFLLFAWVANLIAVLALALTWERNASVRRLSLAFHALFLTSLTALFIYGRFFLPD